MLNICEGFELITYPENETKLKDVLDMFDVVVTGERYHYDYRIGKEPLRFVPKCHVDEDRYDDLIDHLRNRFDGWISLIK